MSDKKTKQQELHTNLRTAILERLQADNDTGGVTCTEGDDLYTANLPEGITTETVKAVHDYNTAFAAAGAGAGVDTAKAIFKANAEITQVNFELPMYGKDKLQVMANRDGSLNVGVVTSVVNHRAGQLKAVFAEFNEAMDELAAK